MNWHFFGLFRFLFSSNEIKYPFRLWTSTQFFISLIFFSSSFKLIHFFLPDWIYSFRFSQCGIAEFRFSLVELHVLFSCFCSVFRFTNQADLCLKFGLQLFNEYPHLIFCLSSTASFVFPKHFSWSHSRNIQHPTHNYFPKSYLLISCQNLEEWFTH